MQKEPGGKKSKETEDKRKKKQRKNNTKMKTGKTDGQIENWFLTPSQPTRKTGHIYIYIHTHTQTGGGGGV